MVSKDSAADYARYRAHLHAHATREIAGALASGRRDSAQRLADGWNRADGLFALWMRDGCRDEDPDVSWEYPPVVIAGSAGTCITCRPRWRGGHDVVVLSRRPSGTDPSTHPSSDEINGGVRVIAAAQDPHEFTFAKDMMAWTLAMATR